MANTIMQKCYWEALRRLRDLHDDEFRSILSGVYEDFGVDVSMRKSRLSSRSRTDS
jgi:hypothetical protein